MADQPASVTGVDVPHLDNWIGGGPMPATAGETFAVRNPLDDRRHCTATKSAAVDVDLAIATAKAAFERDRAKPLKERAIMPISPRQLKTVNMCVVKPDMLPDDLVGTILFLASADSDFISGPIIDVDGGRAMH